MKSVLYISLDSRTIFTITGPPIHFHVQACIDSTSNGQP